MTYGPKRPSPRQRREQRAKRRLALAVLVVAVMCAAAGGLYYLAGEWNPRLGQDLCPLDRPPVEHVVILLDATDPWNAVQRTVMHQEFRRLQDSIQRFARLHLYAIGPEQAGHPTALVALCNPGRPSDFADFPLIGAKGAHVVGNPATLDSIWRNAFVQTLDSVFGIVAETGTASSSPIMETLRMAAIDVFGAASGRALPRSVHLFSDLLQHSSLYSHYRSASWTTKDASRLARLDAAGTSALNGVSVHLYLLDRDITGSGPGKERSALVHFWDTFLSEQGATVVRVRRIEG